MTDRRSVSDAILDLIRVAREYDNGNLTHSRLETTKAEVDAAVKRAVRKHALGGEHQ